MLNGTESAFKKAASLLVEKIYQLKGSNQVNELQALMYKTLVETFNDGWNRYMMRDEELRQNAQR